MSTMTMRGREHGIDLDLYLAGYPKERLAKDEEQRIAALPFGHEDRWKLVQYNMRFAVNWCFKLYNRNRLVSDFDALLSVAQDSMIETALYKFEDRGVDFVGYAAWALRRDTNREVHRQLCVVKLPEFRKENLGKLREDGRYQVSIPLGTDAADRTDTMAHMESAEADKMLEHSELSEVLMHEIKRLIPKQSNRDILVMFYGLDGNEPMGCEEIQQILEQRGEKRSRAGVYFIIESCKAKLSKSSLLKDFLV